MQSSFFFCCFYFLNKNKNFSLNSLLLLNYLSFVACTKICEIKRERKMKRKKKERKKEKKWEMNTKKMKRRFRWWLFILKFISCVSVFFSSFFFISSIKWMFLYLLKKMKFLSLFFTSFISINGKKKNIFLYHGQVSFVFNLIFNDWCDALMKQKKQKSSRRIEKNCHLFFLQKNFDSIYILFVLLIDVKQKYIYI